MARELRPDLVLMDVEMPVMTGVEATRRIREELPNVKVVILTVSEADEPLFDAIRYGAHGYLLKDLRPEQLYELIRAVMRNETALSPAIAGRLLKEFREGTAGRRIASRRGRGPGADPARDPDHAAGLPGPQQQGDRQPPVDHRGHGEEPRPQRAREAPAGEPDPGGRVRRPPRAWLHRPGPLSGTGPHVAHQPTDTLPRPRQSIRSVPTSGWTLPASGHSLALSTIVGGSVPGETQRVVILYAHPLLGEGLERLLGATEGLQIQLVRVDCPDVVEQALLSQPDVVIMERTPIVQAIDLLRLAPNALVVDVGLDAGAELDLSPRPDLAPTRGAAARDRGTRPSGDTRSLTRCTAARSAGPHGPRSKRLERDQ